MNPSRKRPDDGGVAHWLRVALWFQQQRTLLEAPMVEAVQSIQRRFGVSRATAYRWLAAWRDVNGGSTRETA